MPIIEITYPQCVTERMKVEVTQERLEEIRRMTNEEKAEYIFGLLDIEAKESLPCTLEQALVHGYAGMYEKKRL